MKVSVILQTNQSDQFLESQLASIIKQSHQPDELVIISDSYFDEQKDPIKLARQRFPNEIFHIEKQNNQDVIEALKVVSGDVILFSDDSNYWKTNKIEKIHNHFFNEPLVRMIFSNGEVVNSHGQVVIPDYFGISGFYEHWDFFKNLTDVLLRKEVFVPKSFLAIDRKFVNKILSFLDDYPTYKLPMPIEQFISVLFGMYYEPEFLKEIPYVLNQVEIDNQADFKTINDFLKPLSMQEATKWTVEQKRVRFEHFRNWLLHYRDLAVLVNSKHPIINKIEQNIIFQNERLEQLKKGRVSRLLFGIQNLISLNYQQFSSEPLGDFVLDSI